MKRTLGSLLALVGLALVGLPLVQADVEILVDADTPTTDELPLLAQWLDVLPPVDVEAGPLVSLHADSKGDPVVDAGPDEVVGEAPGLASSTDAVAFPEPETALAAAGAATGLALLAGLAAYHWGSLKFLLSGAFLALFSRIDHNRMLDNDLRHRIHEAVANNPGVTIKEITMLVACGWGTAVYHLKRLESERLIVSERNRQFRRFFKNGSGISNDSKGAFSELKNPTSQKIAVTLMAQPGRCQKELCQELGISPPLASKYLGRLKEVGLVSAERDWKTVKYFPTARLEGLLGGAKVPIVSAPFGAPIALAA